MEEAAPIFLKHLVEYWDTRTKEIEQWSAALADLPADQMPTVEARLAAGVAGHVGQLDDAALQKWAFVIADDLFKAASSIPYWSGSVASYLRATAGTFFRLLSGRGYFVHYAVDNSFTQMQRPFELYPAWYAACGVHYECPQRYSGHHGIGAEEARGMSNAQIRQVFASRGHYLWLDVDTASDSFTAFNEQIPHAEVISLYRVEAPTPESKLAVYLGGRPLGESQP